MRIKKAPFSGMQVWELKPPKAADLERAKLIVSRKRVPPRCTEVWESLRDVKEEAAFVLWAVYGITGYAGPCTRLPRFRRKTYGELG
jgi:hypothetical protein